MEIIAECTVDLPSEAEIKSNISQPVQVKSTPLVTELPKITTQPTSSTNLVSQKSSELQPSLVKHQPTVNSSQPISIKSKQVTTISKSVPKAPNPFQQYKEHLPLFIQEFKISDYENGMFN